MPVRRKCLPLLILAGLVMLVYSRAFTADFVEWDDYALVVNNPGIHPPTLQQARSALIRAGG